MDWVFLTRLYRQVPVAPGWLTKQLSKNVDYSPIPKVRLVSETNSLSMATLGNVYDSPVAVSTTVNLSETLVNPAQIFEYDDITEQLIFAENYNPQVLAISNAGDVISSKDYLYWKKLTTLKQRVQNRIEWMFAKMISTGQIQYNDGTRQFQVSFGVTPTTYNLTSTTKIVSDLREMVKEMKAAGHSPEFILITDGVERALWDNTQFTKALDKTGASIAQMRYQEVKDPFVMFVAAIEGLPPIYLYTGEIGGESLISGEKIILVDPNAVGIAYGAIVNAHLDKNMNPIQADVVSWEEVTDFGAKKSLFVMSRPLPYILSANGVMIKNVTIA